MKREEAQDIIQGCLLFNKDDAVELKQKTSSYRCYHKNDAGKLVGYDIRMEPFYIGDEHGPIIAYLNQCHICKRTYYYIV